jgi:hypothetical protein
MGSWGHRPRDNDEAMDLLGYVEDNASLILLAMLRVGDDMEPVRWGLIGVVEVLLDAKFSLHERVAQEASKECRSMLANGERFFETFNDPAEARKACEDVLKRLEGMKKEVPLGLNRAMNRGEGPKRMKRRRASRTRRFRTRKEKKS